MATEKEHRGIWHAGWVQDNSFIMLFSRITLRHRHSLDPGLQKTYPKSTWAAGDCDLKALYARGKRNPSVKHKLREEKAGEQFLGTRTSLCSLLSAPKGSCFYGAWKQCHFCSFLYSMLPADNVLQSGLWVQEHYRNTVWLQTRPSSFSFVTELFTAEWSSLGTFSPWAIQAAQTLWVEWNGRRRHTSNPTSSHRLVEETIPILCQITGRQEQNLHSPNLSSPGKGRKLDGSVSPELDSAHEPPADLGLSILCW